MRPRLIYTREAIRSLDRLAVEQFHIPSIVLMENAAIGIAREAIRMLRGKRRVTIYCGPGNNGGDGLAVARHLCNAGAVVTVVLSGPGSKYKGDAGVNLAIARAMGIRMVGAGARVGGADLVIDALLGTGLDRPVEGAMAELIARMNARLRGARVLSVDIPSGMDADTGRPLGEAVRADVTVTMVGLKAGFLNPASREYTGRIVVVGIGVPRALEERLRIRPRKRSAR